LRPYCDFSIQVPEAVHGLRADIAEAAQGYLTADRGEVLSRFETAMKSRAT